MARWALPEYSVMKQKGVELNMRAVITVIGKDMVGILARVSSDCARHHINVLEVTQSILQDMFAMIMMVDISGSDIPFTEFADEMAAAGREMHLSIHAMRGYLQFDASDLNFPKGGRHSCSTLTIYSKPSP